MMDDDGEERFDEMMWSWNPRAAATSITAKTVTRELGNEIVVAPLLGL
jgi:hypothetical protein